MTDLRIDLIRRVQRDHRFAAAGTDECSQGEHWRCRCGESYKGDGAIERGQRHTAEKILAALDDASVVA